MVLLLIAAHCAQAHRLDDLLQASLIEVTPTEIRLQLNLNPGAQVADAVIWMIDADGNRTITAAEEAAYAKALTRHLALAVDQQPLALEFVSSQFDSPEDLRSGAGNIHIELRAKLPALPAGSHKLRFENRHLPDMSAYLVNALLPRDKAITILNQERNDTQSLGWIEFALAEVKELKPSPHHNSMAASRRSAVE